MNKELKDMITSPNGREPMIFYNARTDGYALDFKIKGEDTVYFADLSFVWGKGNECMIFAYEDWKNDLINWNELTCFNSMNFPGIEVCKEDLEQFVYLFARAMKQKEKQYA